MMAVQKQKAAEKHNVTKEILKEEHLAKENSNLLHV